MTGVFVAHYGSVWLSCAAAGSGGEERGTGGEEAADGGGGADLDAGPGGTDNPLGLSAATLRVVQRAGQPGGAAVGRADV